MEKQVLEHIHNNYVEGVDFKVSDHCNTCIRVLDQEILNDPIVKEYLVRTSKNNE